jgi:hypothetical protein
MLAGVKSEAAATRLKKMTTHNSARPHKTFYDGNYNITNYKYS